LYLFADRTSSATMRANQLRLWFSSLAYVILNELRAVGLRGTRDGRSDLREHAAEAIENRGTREGKRAARGLQHGQRLP